MSPQKAIHFIREHGNLVEQARLAYLLSGEPPSGAITAALFANQRPDGGWAPFWAPDYSSLDATCYRLAQAAQLGLNADEPAIQRALAHLAQRQRPGGAWQEDDAVAELAPPWAMPGDLSATLYLTANCAFWLALLGDHPRQTAAAAAFLQAHLHDQGRLPGFLHTHWLAGALWQALALSEPAARLFAHLHSQIDRLSPANLSWLLTALAAAGLGPDAPLLTTAAARLRTMQQDDGRWPADDGPHQDVHTTLEALRALTAAAQELTNL